MFCTMRQNYFIFISILVLFMLSAEAEAKNTVINFKKKPAHNLLVHPESLLKIDEHVNQQIALGAFPGCQVIGIYKGEVIYNKQFGTLDYNNEQPVLSSTIYDLASISKILATNLAIMKMYENGDINIDHFASEYLPFMKGTNKANLTIKQLLLHEGGLIAWIPFYKETLDEHQFPLTQLYSSNAHEFFRLPVAHQMFMDIRYMNQIWTQIINSQVGKKSYLYSDLDFYFLERIIRMVMNEELDHFVEKKFYKPLALKSTLFNPWKRGLVKVCAPTEIDRYFRHQIIQGYVHDQGAAMMGGVGGHAGLFSTAEEVAILMQMLMNGGEYRQQKLLNKETIDLFTSYQSKYSRRGLGFDKPEKNGKNSPASSKASSATFGHLGFTGTATWADPKHELVYVFLSNRTYPSAEHNQLARAKTRVLLHDYLYEAIGL